MGWQGLGGRRERVPGRRPRGGAAPPGAAPRNPPADGLGGGRSPLKPSGGGFGLRPGAHAFCRVKKALDP